MGSKNWLQKFVLMAMNRNGGPGGPPFKVNGFPVFPDWADEGNGKPEPDPGDHKDNMADEVNEKTEPEINSFPGDAKDNTADEVNAKTEPNPEDIKDRRHELIFEICEIYKIINSLETELTTMEDGEQKQRKQAEVAKMRRARALLDDELAQEILLHELGKNSEALDFWEQKIIIGNNQTIKDLREQVVARLKAERASLLEELIRLHKKRLDN